MIKIGEIGGYKPGSVSARVTPALLRGAKRIGSYLFLSMGDDALWPERALSVSIDSGGLSVVYGARVLSRITVKGVRRYSLESDVYPQPEALAESVKTAAEELHTSAKNITLVLPREWVIARTIELPSSAAENLRAAVSFELDRFTPLSAEDALYDFLTLSESGGTMHLFLAACRADLVSPYIAALADKSISVGRVATSLTAAGTASSYITGATTLAFAEVGSGAYSGGFLVDGRMSALFADSFDGEAPDAKAGKIKEEFSRGPDLLSSGAAASEAVMIGGGAISAETVKRSMPSTTILNDLVDKRLHLKEALPELTLAEIGSIVEALWPKAQGLDLLPKGRRKKQAPPLTLATLLVAALAVMVLIYLIAPLNIERRRVDEIQRQIALLKEPVRKVEVLKKEVEIQENENKSIQEFKNGRVRVIDILREVTNILPKNAWLTRARITEKGVDLEGYANSAADVLPKLEASPFLTKVEFASPTYRDARQNADRFVIKMELEVEKKPDSGGLKNEVKK